MRLLCTSDLHYRLPQLDWVVTQAADVDVVVMPGDHLSLAGHAPVVAQIVVVTKYLERLAEDAVVLASSGNHDLDGPDEHDEQVAGWLQRARIDGVYVDGQSVDLGDTRFTVCPWWDGPHTRERIDVQLAAAAVDRPARWVWAYHSPPPGPLCKSGAKEFPDHDLAALIDQWHPDIVLTGHIHTAPWSDGGGWAQRIGTTWVFNAGHQSGPVPPHVLIDLDAGTATWAAIPEEEQIELS